MIELKNNNVHKIVDSKEKAQKLTSLGFSVFEDKENVMGIETVIGNVIEVQEVQEIREDKKEVIDYSSLTMDQLKGLCKEKNLEGYSNLLKDDLVAFVKENIEG